MVAVNVKPPDAEPGIDQAALYKKLGYADHTPAQQEYSFSTERFNIPTCGRRWGKSIATGHRLTYKSFKPESYNWIVGPTYKLGEKEFRVTYKDFQKLGLLKYCKKSYSVQQGNMRIETPWGAVIEVVSAERPSSLLGEGLSHAVMSEAAQHHRLIWEQYIEPALSDLRGSADFPSTPKGFNWYHGLWMLGQPETKVPGYKSWRFPTWTNKVRYPGGLDDPEIVRIRSVASKVYFDQEYGAQFTAISGAIYEEWDDRIHVRPCTFLPAWSNYLAFDFGFTNPFVCLDIQVDPSENVYVWREYYERYKSTYDHGQVLLKRSNPAGYHVDAAWGDPRGADEIATLSPILGFIAAQDVPWKHGVEAIKRFLKVQDDGFPKLFVDHGCINLRRQLGQLHVKETTQNDKARIIDEHRGDGNIQHKVDDHAADALRYFIGPFFVLGANSHLTDVYGTDYSGSESESFFKLYSSVTMEGSVGYDDLF